MNAVSITLAVLLGVVTIVAVTAVIRARLRERAAIAAAERASRMKDDFVSMVSHELRTPLTSISGFAMTLIESWRHLPEHEVEEFLQIIRTEAGHLQELVEDVLVIPRLEAGRLHLEEELFDLSGLARELALVTFPPGGQREADVAIPGGVKVFADKRRVSQVLRNLLDNARKYGGDQVLVEGAHVGERYMVVVSDNGPGIQEDKQELIFRHFEQLSTGDARSNQGIGLGLPIARRLARAMGGDVWHEARFPTGSRFCFTLRIHPPEGYTESLVESAPAEARLDPMTS